MPVIIGSDKEVEVALYVPEAALPARRALVLVHSCGDVGLVVNGRGTHELPAYSRCPELFPVHTVDATPETKAFAALRPKRGETRVFNVDPGVLRSKYNTLRVENQAREDLVIQRVHLGLW